MEFNNNLFYFLKIIDTIGNLLLFLILMNDVWIKYRSKITTTGVRTRYSKADEKQLPCFTLCPVSGFKKKGFFFRVSDLRKNSLELENILSPVTQFDLKNSANFTISEKLSQLSGRCYTICNLNKWRQKDGPFFFFKYNSDVKIFVHGKGAEFWLSGFGEFPSEVSSVNLGIQNKSGLSTSLMSFKEIESTFISKDEQPCKYYSSIVLGFLNPMSQLRCTDVTTFCMQLRNQLERK